MMSDKLDSLLQTINTDTSADLLISGTTTQNQKGYELKPEYDLGKGCLSKFVFEEPKEPFEFEKDEDENCHIDFIHALANIRAANYKLPEMDWITVKLKAGRIVPALATTTAAIAGL